MALGLSVGVKLLLNGLLMLISVHLLLWKKAQKALKDIKNVVLIKIFLNPPCKSLYWIIRKHCCWCFLCFYARCDEYLLYWIFHSFMFCFSLIETFEANLKSFKAFLYLRGVVTSTRVNECYCWTFHIQFGFSTMCSMKFKLHFLHRTLFLSLHVLLFHKQANCKQKNTKREPSSAPVSSALL